MQPSRILLVRLGAMGDVIHALPAAVTLKRNFPSARVTWIIDPKWAALLEGNPYIDEVLEFDARRPAELPRLWRGLRHRHFDLAVDLQGLAKSAVIVAASGARRRVGFNRHDAREFIASAFYNVRLEKAPQHAVERSLELARLAGATRAHCEFPLPPGQPEGGALPEPFIIASPLAGWASKQWPLEHYAEAATLLRKEGYRLVVNGPPDVFRVLSQIEGACVHISGIAGLVDATRRSAGVIGVDSGPLHLAAALGRPGVAIFGPTDPACNGPYGGTVTVLRHPAARTTYKRDREIAASMHAMGAEAIVDALRIRLQFRAGRTSA